MTECPSWRVQASSMVPGLVHTGQSLSDLIECRRSSPVKRALVHHHPRSAQFRRRHSAAHSTPSITQNDPGRGGVLSAHDRHSVAVSAPPVIESSGVAGPPRAAVPAGRRPAGTVPETRAAAPEARDTALRDPIGRRRGRFHLPDREESGGCFERHAARERTLHGSAAGGPRQGAAPGVRAPLLSCARTSIALCGPSRRATRSSK